MVFDSTMVLGLSVGGVAVTLGFVYWKFSSVMPFLYSNARIQARSNHILSKTKVESLAEVKNLSEIISALQDTEYAPFIENTTDIRKIHSGIEKGFVDSIKDLRKSAPKNIWPILDAYNMFWEAKIIKTFYRQRFTQKDSITLLDETIVFPIGSFNAELIKHLTESKSIADLKVVLSDTVYSNVFDIEVDSLEEFEVALDNVVFEQFVKVVKETKINDSSIIIDVFNTKFDILNLLVLLKCEARNIDEDKRKKLLIENDSLLFNRADSLVYAKGVRDLVEKCKGLPFFNSLEKALVEYVKDNSLSHFEKYLLTFYREKVEDQELAHFQGSFPLISFLVKKELEQRNLLIITKGIDSGFTPVEIKELLV